MERAARPRPIRRRRDRRGHPGVRGGGWRRLDDVELAVGHEPTADHDGLGHARGPRPAPRARRRRRPPPRAWSGWISERSGVCGPSRCPTSAAPASSSSERTVVVGADDGTVTAVDLDGQERWTQDVGDHVLAPMAATDDLVFASVRPESRGPATLVALRTHRRFASVAIRAAGRGARPRRAEHRDGHVGHLDRVRRRIRCLRARPVRCRRVATVGRTALLADSWLAAGGDRRTRWSSPTSPAPSTRSIRRPVRSAGGSPRTARRSRRRSSPGHR